MSAWAEGFEAFGPHHLVVVVVCGLLMAGMSWWGVRVRRRGGDPAGRRLDAWMGSAGLGLALFSHGWWALGEPFDASVGLPLHLCDLAVVLAPLAVLWPARALRALLYFWGLVLSSQAFVQPVLEAGAGEVRYWLFWVNHVMIVGFAIYDVVARGFRPRARDLLVGCVVTTLYVAALFGVNAATGWNYGYVGPTTPENPTLLDALGPWPWRAVLLVLIGNAGFVLAWAPWWVAGRLGGAGRGR